MPLLEQGIQVSRFPGIGPWDLGYIGIGRATVKTFGGHTPSSRANPGPETEVSLSETPEARSLGISKASPGLTRGTVHENQLGIMITTQAHIL